MKKLTIPELRIILENLKVDYNIDPGKDICLDVETLYNILECAEVYLGK